VDTFIPNDVYLDPSRNIAVITGPNCSGKSVYLKQVGLVVYMAMIGCYVPAEKAMVGVVDGIYSRISTVETQATPQSSFAMDLTQMSRLLQSQTRTPRSLCLVDEFGKGTNPADGIALLAASLQELGQSAQPLAPGKPFVLVVTHFTEVLHPELMGRQTLEAVLPYQMTIASRRAAVQGQGLGQGQGQGDENGNGNGNDNVNDVDDEELTPLFKLARGIAHDSMGLACALKAGVPRHIVARAKQIRACVQARVSIPARPTTKIRELVTPSFRLALRLLLGRSVEEWRLGSPEMLQEMRCLMGAGAAQAVGAAIGDAGGAVGGGEST